MLRAAAALIVSLAGACDKPTEAVGAGAPGAVHWESTETAAFARAAREGKAVLIDIRSDWCVACTDLERTTFADREVAGFIARNFVALKLDVTEASEADHAVQARYRAPTLPAVIFLDRDRRERGRIDEFVPPAEFLAAARRALAAGDPAPR